MAATPAWQAAQGQAAAGQYSPGPGAQGQYNPGQYAPGQGASLQGPPRQAADSKSFFGALFDFSFTSFVTTSIIKVLYILILILVGLATLIYVILAFSASPGLGLLTLVLSVPFVIIVMAFWRLVLEAFVVIFRIAEDVHALRERSDR